MIYINKFVGWRRNLLAFALGICATLTLAPFYLFPLIIPAYAGLFLLVDNAPTRKRAFADGWWWGWGFFITGLYWFCIALLTDAEKFAWAIPLALFPLNAIIALYPALACLLYRLSSPRRRGSYHPKIPAYAGMTRILAFATIWLVTEYARGHLFSGFPWNLAGYSFGFSDISLQLASVLGAYGLTFFTVLLGASCALIRTNRIFIFCIWGLFATSLAWGNFRLANAEQGADTGVMLRLVQANIQQHHKWRPELQQQNLEEYIRLTQSAGIENVTHVIWPETAVPYALRSDTAIAYHLSESLPAGVTLVTGALRMEGQGDDSRFFNSVVLLNDVGKIIGNYDKHALVPFGEFMPLRFLIPKSLNLPVGDKDFSSGVGVQTLNWKGLPPVSVLVCYEVIFPESIVDSKNPPKWLLNVTNDAWFGMSSGPHQHFEMARMRAVEQGLPLIRVANTGITAYIDEYGRIKRQLALGASGVLDISLLESDVSVTTYRQYGVVVIQFLICCYLAFAIIFGVLDKKLTKN